MKVKRREYICKGDCKYEGDRTSIKRCRSSINVDSTSINEIKGIYMVNSNRLTMNFYIRVVVN